MKKLLAVFILLYLFFILTACSDDRSFSIDDVTIDAKIQEDGSIHVRELFTYTFDGSYEGMTRSIESDADNFNAFLADRSDPNVTTENLESLEVEEEDDTYEIYSDSSNETKRVLYSYDVNGSVKKYTDVADLSYAFFDDSNETDLNDVTITIHPPEGTGTDNQHFFLHEDHTGELTSLENGIQYKNSLLKASTNSQIRFVFPSDQMSEMELTRDQTMEDVILAEEQELAERAEGLEGNMSQIMPAILVLLGLLITCAIVMLIFHPNRYRGPKDTEVLYRLVEETDPLFVKYMNEVEQFPDDSFIAGLLSLKQRGVITLEKVPSAIMEDKETFRFTWIDNEADLDSADRYLRTWLFTESDENGLYFLLESLIDHEVESEEVKEAKVKHFRKHFDKWIEKVKVREVYHHLRMPFKGYSMLSIPLLFVSFGLFYYFTTIDTIGRTEQWLLPLIAGIITVAALFFNRNKWVLYGYYFILLLITAVGFSLEPAVIMTLTFYGLSLIVLLVIPNYYRNESARQMKYAIKRAYQSFKNKNYPIGNDPNSVERRLEYAIVLGAGENYGERCKTSAPTTTMETYYPLLTNPVYATTSLTASNIALYTTAVHTSSSNTTTSATGGGGAGAF